MYVFSIFEQTAKIEEAITSLQTKGISKDAILAIPMNSRNESKGLFDTTHYSDNSSTLAVPFVLATMGTLVCAALGFQYVWGPIIWALIGAITGLSIGLIFSVTKALIKKRHQHKATKENVILMVNCENAQSEFVQDILWSNTAIGVNTFSQ